MVCGKKVWGDIMSWQSEGLRVKPGSLEKYGVKSKVIMTSWGDIEVQVLDMFNRGRFQSQALIMCMDKLDYVYLSNRDIGVRKNIQGNSVDGREDEIYGEISMGVNDGGYGIHKLSNCN